MSPTTAHVEHATVFTITSFCKLWADVFDLCWEPFDGSDHVGLVFSESRRLGLRDYRLAPRGLYWVTSGAGEDEAAALTDSALAHLRQRRTLGIT